MQTILFTDLDDTLFATERKQGKTANCQLASTLSDGSPSGYCHQKQQHFFQLWQQNALIIPVTARSVNAYQRVLLPFNNYAIVNHGGTILLPNGACDPDWQQQVRAYHSETQDWLMRQLAVFQHIAHEQACDIRHSIQKEGNMPLYLLIKHNQNDAQALAELVQTYRRQYPQTWQHATLHLNDNNFALLPHWLGKANAVTYLMDKLKAQYGDCLTIGCGDSQSDLAFMRCCDYWITPTHSQIDQNL